jgi:hypothetical protein
MPNRVFLRLACVVGAVGCLGAAAYLALDWADYGSDSTCGNFIRYKGNGGACADIMRNRVLGVIGLVALAALLVAVAAWSKRARGGVSSD